MGGSSTSHLRPTIVNVMCLGGGIGPADLTRLPNQSTIFDGLFNGPMSLNRRRTGASRHAGTSLVLYRVIRSPLPLEGRLARQARTSRKS